MMTPPTTNYGAPISSYPGSMNRYLVIVIGIVALYMGVSGNAFGGQWDTPSRWYLAALGIVLFVAFYFKLRGAHAQLFDQGFSFARAGVTTSGRWNEIASITRQAKRWYLFALIPLPGTVSNTYTLKLTNGKQVEISGSYYSNVEQMVATIQRMREKVPAVQPDSPAS